ncbi:hypothetical protein [Sphingomonas mucosissima]|uniref:Glycosyltransferase RgtA/B/C/D-like domain-containing protein n=1 Tax=Sphingomonas mucosissima TaxID=370959 RepID=A0A245ZRT3_9SPHN|nr:hypothetical protein [Sphingomonas mucosissima]OWK32451.1 hypothetical protein SPMU_07820 [Sphingomonas mucosissima]
MTRAAVRPLWLAAPSRYAGRSRRHARWLLAVLALLLLAALIAPGTSGSAAAGTEAADQANEIVYARIVDDLRHGDDYYTATARALRSAGAPLQPFHVFRLPTLAVLQAKVSQVSAALLLYALALLSLFAWWKRLADAVPRFPARPIALLLAAVGVTSAVLGHLVATHDLWAGLIVSLSLASRKPGRWITAAALGLSAALIRETAALYVVVMLVLALLEGQRREAAGWAGALALFAVAVVLHAQAVASVTGPLDQSLAAWSGASGFGFAVRAVASATALSLLPPALGAIAVALSLAGWSAWRDPLAARALATIVVQLLSMSFLAGPDTADWAFLIAPIAPIGLTFFPDALRDLSRAALDRRRITVTRTSA